MAGAAAIQNRMFRQYAGLSTQSFCQTIRLQYACRWLYYEPQNTLNTAIELGYFDQAHLLNDYKKYLFKNPKVFSQRFKSDFYNSNQSL
ncbi:MAG: AraC family transcriptional regulator [Pseudomonadales bacterium]|nr:AraC family transcriptional regulator [Pseudomonadales bacterium]